MGQQAGAPAESVVPGSLKALLEAPGSQGDRFALFRTSTDWTQPTHTMWGGDLLTPN